MTTNFQKYLILIFSSLLLFAGHTHAMIPPITLKVVIVRATDIPPYNRPDWGQWIDADGDCQDTRQEVLIEESKEPVTFETSKRCTVKSGKWIDPFTGKIYTNPADLEIDHLVPLKNVHDCGGWKWSPKQKRDYVNNLTDSRHLNAVSKFTNAQKGARTPDQWRPPYPAAF